MRANYPEAYAYLKAKRARHPKEDAVEDYTQWTVSAPGSLASLARPPLTASEDARANAMQEPCDHFFFPRRLPSVPTLRASPRRVSSSVWPTTRWRASRSRATRRQRPRRRPHPPRRRRRRRSTSRAAARSTCTRPSRRGARRAHTRPHRQQPPSLSLSLSLSLRRLLRAPAHRELTLSLSATCLMRFGSRGAGGKFFTIGGGGDGGVSYQVI